MLWPFFGAAVVILIFLAILYDSRNNSEAKSMCIVVAFLITFGWILFSCVIPMNEEQKLFQHDQFFYNQFNGTTYIVTYEGHTYSSDKALIYNAITNSKSQFLVVNKFSEWGVSLDQQREIKVIIPHE